MIFIIFKTTGLKIASNKSNKSNELNEDMEDESASAQHIINHEHINTNVVIHDLYDGAGLSSRIPDLPPLRTIEATRQTRRKGNMKIFKISNTIKKDSVEVRRQNEG